MKKTIKKTDTAAFITVIILGIVMLITHAWILGIIGAAFCIKAAFGKNSKTTKRQHKAKKTCVSLYETAGTQAALHVFCQNPYAEAPVKATSSDRAFEQRTA